MDNKGYEEIGKGFISLANMISVIYLLNNVLSQDQGVGWTEGVLIVCVLIFCFALYASGYHMIRKSQGVCDG